MNNKYRHQQGMTLIEIMVAMTLGVFLLGGVIQIFISSKQSYRMQENLSRMQENGRFSMQFISQDMRTANYRSCFNDLILPIIAGVPGAMVGTNDAGLNGSDTITIGQKTNACGGLDSSTTTTYTIQNDISGIPSLFRRIDTVDAAGNITAGVATALVEGVENMQIVYGEDIDADSTPNYYVPAGTAGLNMDQVVSVRLSLLITSLEDHLSSVSRTYSYNGVDTTPTDKKFRRVFASTIALRNRLN